MGNASIGHPLCARAPSAPDNALSGLAALFLWLSGLALLCPRQCVCVCGPIRVSEERAVTSSSSILFCLLLCLSVSIFMALSSCALDASDLLSRILVFSSSFAFLCPIPSVSISLDFCLLLLRCSSVALFIHSHSLPCCLFVFGAFWSSLM